MLTNSAGDQIKSDMVFMLTLMSSQWRSVANNTNKATLI